MIPSERFHVHGNKQLLPRTRIVIFKTSFSFSGFLAWNSLPHHLRHPCIFLSSFTFVFHIKVNFQYLYFQALLYSFTFLVVIILMCYMCVCVCECMCCRLTSSLAGCDLFFYCNIYIEREIFTLLSFSFIHLK